MKKIIACAFAGLLSFAACETTMGMNVAAMLQQRDPKNGNTALHAAVKKGNISIVQLLLPYCTANDVNAVNSDGWAALHLAAENGELDMFKLLLGHPGINVNIADDDGKTPLYIAIEKWNDDIASVLILTPGIDVNAPTNAARTPIGLAAEKGNTNIVQLLLAHPNINPDMDPSICYAINKTNANEDDIQTALLLINDKQVNVNHSWRNPLSIAIPHQNMTIIKALFGRQDLDLSKNYSATIISEALSSNKEILGLLLSDSRYDAEARAVALTSIAEHYKDSWNDELVLMVLNDPKINLGGMIDEEKGWFCPPFMQLVLSDKKNLKLFKLILQNLKSNLNQKFLPKIMNPELAAKTPGIEEILDKIEPMSPFEFLIAKLDSNKNNYVEYSIEDLSKLFLFRKMAPKTMLVQDALQQWVSERYPDLVKSKLWKHIIDIAYGDKPELSMFSLLSENDYMFNLGMWDFDCLKKLCERLVFFREFFTPQQAELQQWINEKYPAFAASEACRRLLDMLFGSKKD